YDHLPRGHRTTANSARRPAHLPDAPRSLDTPSWRRVLPLVAIKAPRRRLGTVPCLDGARLSALLFIRPPAQRSRKEGKRANRRQVGGRRREFPAALRGLRKRGFSVERIQHERT